MGYVMTQTASQFRIRGDNRVSAREALRGLARSGVRISWADEGTIERATSLTEQLAECGWMCTAEEMGDITAIQFDREKAGDEEAMFGAIAPYVEPGSYIEMRGEDGDRWRWRFEGGKLVTQRARVVWD